MFTNAILYKFLATVIPYSNCVVPTSLLAVHLTLHSTGWGRGESPRNPGQGLSILLWCPFTY